MDFLICYEHIVREIENDTLLKHELEKRGYSCKIIHFNDIDYCVHTTKEKAKVVVTPWLRYDSNVYHYLQYAQKPYKLVNLQWEQVYIEHTLKSGFTQTDGQALQAQHLCWGGNSANRLIAQGASGENVATLGAIQMDYGRHLFAGYYLSKGSIAQQFGLDTNKKWNLLVSSFAYATYRDESIKKLEKAFNSSLEQLVNLHKKSQKLALDWIERLLQVSDNEFIYRPHPSERVDPRLTAMEEKYPNFHVIFDYSVKQWAKICEKVNLWMSTSNAELLAMGVDFCVFRPVEVPRKYEIESMRNEEFITDCEDFIRYNMTFGEDNESEIATKLERISHYYSYDPEYPAYKRIADYLESVLKSEKGQKYHFTMKQHMTFAGEELRNFVVSKLTRKCYLDGNMKSVERLPLPSAIKLNMKKAIGKRQDKEDLENKMLEYLKTHDC